MFNFFKMGRGNQKPDGSVTAEPTPAQSRPSVPGNRPQPATTSHELARTVLRDTLRMNGIPSDWIGCETIPQHQGGGDDSLLIQLVINRWHEGLVTYAPLLQQQFQQELMRFDPASDHSRHVMVWKFSPTCGYPGTVMPTPDFWTAKPVGVAKRKFDLPPSNRDQLDDGFAPTVPGELR